MSGHDHAAAQLGERVGDGEAGHAEAEHENFADELVQRVARRLAMPVAAVEATLTEWFDRRPLQFLGRHAVPGLPALFDGLRRSGIQIGVLSDYPAADKLDALGLKADIVVSATDNDVGILKPHPRGLSALLARAGRGAGEAVMIGDRADRDGAIASRLGTRFLLRGRGSDAHFWRYDDDVFRPVLMQ